MDWLTLKDKFLENIKKYRYLLLAVLSGVLLMTLPEQSKTDVPIQKEIRDTKEDFQESLADILEQISGAGKVAVLLTKAEGEETCYQVDVDSSSNNLREDTVLVIDAQRNETGLIKQINPPVYLGALVICQGADNANVRLSIVKAVMSVTGLTSDRITVLKMK